MPAAAVNRITRSEIGDDCAIHALARYLEGASYEDVLRAAALIEKRYNGSAGLYTKTMIRVGAKLGHTLRHRKPRDLEDAYGVLLFDGHAVMVRGGLVFEADATVWELTDYLRTTAASHGAPCGLLVAVE